MTNEIENLEILDEEPISLIDKLKNMPMTYYLVAINVLVFILVHGANLFIDSNWLVSRLMKSTYHISINHEYYRLFTAIFTHESIPHIFFNSMAIIFLGKPVEQIFGKSKFLIIFLVSGLFGSLSSFIFSAAPAIGASGGVFGMFGVHIYLFLVNKSKYLSIFGKDMFQLLIMNVVIGFVIPNIDYWGHFGGILGGFLATASLGLYHTIKLNKNLLLGSLLTLTIFIGSFMYFNQGYKTYIENVDTLVDQANYAINTQDINALKTSRDDLDDLIPFLPPISGSDDLLNQIDEFIIKIDN